MEMYLNNNWIERYGKTYISEAIAYSENGNHATIYAMGITAGEADAKAGVYEDEHGRYDIDERFRATLVFMDQDGGRRLASLQLSPILGRP